MVKFLLELLLPVLKLLDWGMGIWKGKKRGRNGQNILLVEDLENDAILIRNCLRRAGYETVWVKDKQSALDSMRRLKHRVVFIDVGLGRQNGWDVRRAIRMAGFSPDVTTIMMMSGSKESFEAKPDGEAVMMIEKPTNDRWEAFVDAVRQAGL